MNSDLHIHPLAHKYYFSMDGGFSAVTLDDDDKQKIRAVVDWCCHNRGLDSIALTDHDMIQASLYAMEYVKQAALPIEIIAGAECSVRDSHKEMGNDEVHLICLGIDRLPRYDSQTPVDQLIRSLRKLGGFVIMSHPIQYPDSFFRYCHLLDGYEYQSGDKPPFEDGKRYADVQGLSLRVFNNSDFHYYGKFPDIASRELRSSEYEESALRG